MSEIKYYRKGSVIFKEGAYELSMFSVVSGKVGIFADYKTRDEKVLAELGKGRIFGEMGLIEAKPRSATALALEDTECEVITPDNLESFFENKPEMAIETLKGMSKRIRELSDDYTNVCDTLGVYVEAEKSKKGSFLDKLKSFFSVDYDCSDIYKSMIDEGSELSMMKRVYWY